MRGGGDPYPIPDTRRTTTSSPCSPLSFSVGSSTTPPRTRSRSGRRPCSPRSATRPSPRPPPPRRLPSPRARTRRTTATVARRQLSASSPRHLAARSAPPSRRGRGRRRDVARDTQPHSISVRAFSVVCALSARVIYSLGPIGRISKGCRRSGSPCDLFASGLPRPSCA